MVNPELVESVFVTVQNLLRFDSEYAWIGERFDIEDITQTAVVLSIEGGMYGIGETVSSIAKRALGKAIHQAIEDSQTAVDSLCCDSSVNARVEQQLPESYPGKRIKRIHVGLRRETPIEDLVPCPVLTAALDRYRTLRIENPVSLIQQIGMDSPTRLADTLERRQLTFEEFGIESDETDIFYHVDQFGWTEDMERQVASCGVWFGFETDPNRRLFSYLE